MILETGSKLLVCHRRLFADDMLRFFAGTVEACESGIAKVTGYTWTRDPQRGFERKHDSRTKIIALNTGMLLIYELPKTIAVEELRIEQPTPRSVIMTDGANFKMDLTEKPERGPGK